MYICRVRYLSGGAKRLARLLVFVCVCVSSLFRSCVCVNNFHCIYTFPITCVRSVYINLLNGLIKKWLEYTRKQYEFMHMTTHSGSHHFWNNNNNNNQNICAQRVSDVGELLRVYKPGFCVWRYTFIQSGLSQNVRRRRRQHTTNAAVCTTNSYYIFICASLLHFGGRRWNINFNKIFYKNNCVHKPNKTHTHTHTKFPIKLFFCMAPPQIYFFLISVHKYFVNEFICK